jgi:WS/DGAT/MGAT family acyltransferase
MKQLGTLDTAFVNLEHRNTPQHIGGLGIYDPSTAPGGSVRFKDVIARFEKKLNKLPLFRTRLVQVPGGHDKPYWVKDANFDVEFHLRHIALPHPGDWRQLCILISRIHSRPIDMSRPLWEAYIIEGLDNIEGLPKGCFAVYTKIHHSLVDGAGGASFMSVLHDLEPDPAEEDSGLQEEVFLAEKQPGSMQLRANALAHRVSDYSSMIRNTFPVAKNISRTLWNMAKGNVAAPPLLNSPKNRFSQPVGPYRVLEAALLDLDGFKLVKNVTGTKINDVALCVIGGGMRKYLEHHGELPLESLVSAIPMDMRTRRGDNHENNQLGSMFTSLHTDIADPIERLHAIHASTDEAKDFSEDNPLVDALQLGGIFSPRLTHRLINFYVDNKLSEHVPVNISTVVSNVPGPNFPLYSCGAKLVRYHGIGLLTPGVGLFHLIFSYCGTVSVTVLGDRDIIPDPSLYQQCLVEAYNELKAEAEKLASEQKKKASSIKKKTASSAKLNVVEIDDKTESTDTVADTETRKRTKKASSKSDKGDDKEKEAS